MNKITACVAAIAALIAAPAFAAPLPPPAPVYTWTGWYVGGNVGYSWGDADSDLNGAGTATSQIEPGGFKGFPFPIQFNGGSDTVRLKGAIGGAQVGYNYQVNSLWVCFAPLGPYGYTCSIRAVRDGEETLLVLG